MYFLKSVVKKRGLKLVPLEYQDGIDSSKNVSVAPGSRSTWAGYPVGTIFSVGWLSKVYVGSGSLFSYYKSGWPSKIDTEHDHYYLSYVKKVEEKAIEVEETIEEVLDTPAEDKATTDEYYDVAAPTESCKEDAGKEAATSTPKEEKKEETKPEEPKEPTLREKIVSDASLKAPTSKEDGFFVSKDDWTLLVRNIKNHVNTMIVGPTGCGKTSVVREICRRMGKKLYTFDMGTMMDPASSLLGVHRLKKGESTFDYAKFTQVIKEPCVILLDELSRAPLSAMNVLFSCLDDRRNLNVEIALGEEEREIDVNPEVTFVATANVGSEYSGTNSMDRALVNRFFPLELGCIPSKEEVAVLKKRTGIAEDKADIIVKIANNIRSLCNKQEISVSLSIRETLMVAGLVSDGWDIAKAMEMVYLPLYEGTKTEGERSIIYKTIASY